MYHGERFNSITHLFGTGLAISGSTLLIVHAAQQGDPWKIVSFSVFGAIAEDAIRALRATSLRDPRVTVRRDQPKRATR